MLDLSRSTEKSYTFPTKDISPKSRVLNSLDMVPRQNWDGKLLF